MLFYDRISESGDIDANHTGLGIFKEYNVYHFYLLKDRNFLYKTLFWNECDAPSLRAISLMIFKVISVKGKTYRVVSNESSSLIDKFGSL